MITTVIDAIPPAGKRGVQSRDDFVTTQEAFQDKLTADTVDQMNSVGEEMNTTAASINSDAIIAESSAKIATGAANYKSDWTVGATYDQGDSVSYTDGYTYVSKIDNNTGTPPITQQSTPEWYYKLLDLPLPIPASRFIAGDLSIVSLALKIDNKNVILPKGVDVNGGYTSIALTSLTENPIPTNGYYDGNQYLKQIEDGSWSAVKNKPIFGELGAFSECFLPRYNKWFEALNLVSNGDFSDGAVGWESYSSVTSVSFANGIASVVTSTAGSGFGNSDNLLTVIANKAYKIVVNIRTSIDNVRLQLRDGDGSLHSYVPLNCDVLDEWVEHTIYFTPLISGNNAKIRVTSILDGLTEFDSDNISVQPIEYTEADLTELPSQTYLNDGDKLVQIEVLTGDVVDIHKVEYFPTFVTDSIVAKRITTPDGDDYITGKSSQALSESESLTISETTITLTKGDGSTNEVQLPVREAVGEIGTYAFLAYNIDNPVIAAGTIVAGSTLRYSAIGSSSINAVGVSHKVTLGAETPAGSWKFMGEITTSAAGYKHSTLFLRIS